MANTSWRRIDSFGSGEVQARENATFSRTNNTLHVSNFRSQWRVTTPGNDTSISTQSYMPSGTNRRTTNFGSRSWSANQVFSGTTWSGNISVGANDTTISTRTRWADYSGAWYNSTANFSIPAAGSPSFGAPTFSNLTHNSATLKGTVSSWGANCTAGQGVRFGVWWSGKDQHYNSRTTSTSPSWNLTGLPSNTVINADMDAINGAGKSYDGANASTTTLPLAAVAGTPEFLATSATIPYTQDVGGGVYAITNQYRLKKGEEAYGDWTTVTGGSIELSGLLPNAEYTVELRSTTTAGTTVGGTTTFTTLPAGKLIYPDGTVKNAIPRLVKPDASPAEMININLVDPL